MSITASAYERNFLQRTELISLLQLLGYKNFITTTHEAPLSEFGYSFFHPMFDETWFLTTKQRRDT